MLEFIESIAREAGEILSQGYENLEHDQIDFKGRRDLVTDIDRRSEAFLADRISTTFPDDAILAEESIRRAGTSGRVWILDPLDGTTNFVHGHPMFCVSIALADNYTGMTSTDLANLPGPQESGFDRHASGLFATGQFPRLLAASVAAPILGEVYSAELGKGTTRNGKPVQVSTQCELEGSLVATGLPYRRNELENCNLGNINQVALQVQGIRRGGSASLDLCFLAAGRFDGYWELYLKSWDTCPGILLVQEAGGRVTDFDGGERAYEGVEIIATNGKIHEELVSLLTKGDPDWIVEERAKFI